MVRKLLLGRIRVGTSSDRPEWIEGSFGFDSYDTAVRELLALGSEVEILLPTDLRETMAAVGSRIARLHATTTGSHGSPPATS